MANTISGIYNSVGRIQTPFKSVTETSGGSQGSDFSSILSKSMQDYVDLENSSDQDTLNLLTGNTDDLASTMVSSEKTQLALELTVQVRNKAIDAYKEIMNMQI